MPSVTFVDDGAPEMGLYDSDGNIRVTVGDTSNSYGILARNGSFRGTLVDDDSAGVYAMDGSFNFYLVDGFAYFIGGLAKALINISGTYEPPSSFSAARVGRAVALLAQNFSVGATIPFDEELYDVGDWFDIAAPTRLTVPAGVSYVVVKARCTTSNSTVATPNLFQIYKNGVAAFDGWTGNTISSNNVNVVVVSGAIPVVEGDYFEVFLRFPSDVSIDIDADTTFFSIEAVE